MALKQRPRLNMMLFKHTIWTIPPELAQGPVVRSPIKLILGLRKFNCYLFTAKGGFATKLGPNKVINYKFLFLKP